MVDPYINDIQEKDESSRILADLSSKTLDRKYIRQLTSGKNGLSFAQVPEDMVLVGHMSEGDLRITEPEAYARSVVHNLARDSMVLGATPLAMADVIDAQNTSPEFARKVGTALSESALEAKVAILNGELAKYGPMVNCPCNIAGTMISMLPQDSRFVTSSWVVGRPESPVEVGWYNSNGTQYFFFKPAGKLVSLNSDGTGTNTLCGSRFNKYIESVINAFAMQYDDQGKLGGGALATFNIVETNTNAPQTSAEVYSRENIKLGKIFTSMEEHGKELAKSMNSYSIMQHSHVGNRLIGPHGEKFVWNISGTLVSLLTEDMIQNMPRPQVGDTLVVVKGNGRSNGFTDRRNLLVEWFGEDWERTEGGRYFGDFVTKPSILFYPMFTDLISQGLATSVFHLSGGAWDDKVSAPIARQELYAEIGIAEGSPRLFSPDPREAAFASQFNLRNAHRKFALGNEGAVTTKQPEKVIPYFQSRGYEAKAAAILENRLDIKGLKIRAFNGDIVDFSSKK